MPVKQRYQSFRRHCQSVRDRFERSKPGIGFWTLAMDAAAACPSVILAFLLVLERADWPGEIRTVALIGFGYSALAALVFALFRVETRIWRYYSRKDLLKLGGASACVSAIGGVLLALAGGFGVVALEFAVVQGIVFVLLLVSFRFVWRGMAGRTRKAPAESAERVPVLLVDLGFECGLFVRRACRPSSGIVAVGIVAEKQAGRSVNDVPIVGGLDDLEGIVSRLEAEGRRPKQLVFTRKRPEAQVQEVRRVVERLGLSVCELPSTAEMLRAPEAPAEPITLSSLRGQDARPAIDTTCIARSIAGRRLLVTGAGGSIGSELVRLLAELGPASIALVDNSEFNLYKIDRELTERFPSVPSLPSVADVRDRRRLAQIFDEVRPEIVFHGAALKHVPMVEANACEGIRTNVVGSRNVAEAALQAGALAMVQISTNKAVNPVNVMGASKRLAEVYCQALDVAVGRGEARGPQPTRFMTVRFGNVWGSSGSVVPLFEQQIARGGPVTVTHPDIERYFMTIREACELVIHAAVGGLRTDAERGLVYVLDMGAPLRIADVARQLVRLHGKRPDDDVRIEYVGLRPGEKLYEELFDATEERMPGPDAGILAARSATGSYQEVSAMLGRIGALAEEGDDGRARDLLARMVPALGGVYRRHDGQAAA